MTEEERAQRIAGQYYPQNTIGYLNLGAAIAAAIREAVEDARAAAILQAAHVAQAIWLDARDTDFDCGVNDAKRAIADAILSLKAKS